MSTLSPKQDRNSSLAPLSLNQSHHYFPIVYKKLNKNLHTPRPNISIHHKTSNISSSKSNKLKVRSQRQKKTSILDFYKGRSNELITSSSKKTNNYKLLSRFLTPHLLKNKFKESKSQSRSKFIKQFYISPSSNTTFLKENPNRICDRSNSYQKLNQSETNYKRNKLKILKKWINNQNNKFEELKKNSKFKKIVKEVDISKINQKLLKRVFDTLKRFEKAILDLHSKCSKKMSIFHQKIDQFLNIEFPNFKLYRLLIFGTKSGQEIPEGITYSFPETIQRKYMLRFLDNKDNYPLIQQK